MALMLVLDLPYNLMNKLYFIHHVCFTIAILGHTYSHDVSYLSCLFNMERNNIKKSDFVCSSLYMI